MIFTHLISLIPHPPRPLPWTPSASPPCDTPAGCAKRRRSNEAFEVKKVTHPGSADNLHQGCVTFVFCSDLSCWVLSIGAHQFRTNLTLCFIEIYWDTWSWLFRERACRAVLSRSTPCQIQGNVVSCWHRQPEPRQRHLRRHPAENRRVSGRAGHSVGGIPTLEIYNPLTGEKIKIRY